MPSEFSYWERHGSYKPRVGSEGKARLSEDAVRPRPEAAASWPLVRPWLNDMHTLSLLISSLTRSQGEEITDRVDGCPRRRS